MHLKDLEEISGTLINVEQSPVFEGLRARGKISDPLWPSVDALDA
jgi:hypothetical protein